MDDEREQPPEHIASRCANPVRLKSGDWVRCQSRVKSRCASCAELYRGDWARIARSGVFDGPVERYRFYLLTLTAPSFGKVHRVPRSEGKPARRCGCGASHSVADAGLRGVPLDPTTYDYAGQVAWNRDAGLLWDRTRRRLRDRWDSIEFFLVREWQDRGVLHLHVLARVARGEAPPAPALGRAARTAVAYSRIDGALVEWGEQVDSAAFRADGDGARTIWYLSKALNYVMKDTALAAMGGRGSNLAWAHLAALEDAARAMRCSPSCVPGECGSRVHERYGSRSHVVSATRRTRHRSGWSFTGLTRKLQRALRGEWMESRDTGEGERVPSERVREVAVALADQRRSAVAAVAAVVP